MTIEERISAFIDGELSAADNTEVERLLQSDEAARACLQRMQAANAHIREEFSSALEAPVPLALAKAVMDAPEPEAVTGSVAAASAPARSGRPMLQAIAASVLLVISVGAAGYLGYQSGARQSETIVAAKRGWLDDIADYHRVYAAEQRHLVEVGPDQTTHLEAWLGNRTKTPFKVPDLTGDGLEFSGGRLLVAAGRPVAQLIYKSPEGAVFALCFTSTGAGDGPVTFKASNFDDLDMVSWKKSGSSFVVVGPAGNRKIEPVAKAVSRLI